MRSEDLLAIDEPVAKRKRPLLLLSSDDEDEPKSPPQKRVAVAASASAVSKPQAMSGAKAASKGEKESRQLERKILRKRKNSDLAPSVKLNDASDGFITDKDEKPAQIKHRRKTVFRSPSATPKVADASLKAAAKPAERTNVADTSSEQKQKVKYVPNGVCL